MVVGMTDDVVRLLTDLRERLCRAGDELEGLAQRSAASHAVTEYGRITGKQEGVKLAVSYVDEYLRDELILRQHNAQ